MGMIPFRVLNDCIHKRNYTLICDCGKRARFVGVFYVGSPDWPMGSKEALFLCADCAAQVDDGVELHSLSKKTIRAELDSFAETQRAETERKKERRQAMTPEERRARKKEQRRAIKESDPEAWRKRYRRYYKKHYENRTPEQIEAKRERDRIRYHQRKAEQQQQGGRQ